MNAPTRRVQVLTQAVQLVNEALNALDDSSSTCERCNRLHYTNWSEHQASEALVGVRQKIIRIRDELAAADGVTMTTPRASKMKG